jgi:hypothetical protein
MATSLGIILAAMIASVIFNSQLLMVGSMPTGDPILIGSVILLLIFTLAGQGFH